MMADQASAAAPTPKQYFSGIVKQVLDGGLVVIRGQPRNGPPPERTIALSEIEVPKTTRRPNPTTPVPQPDEPCGWEAREFLRKLLVGRSVLCSVSYKVPSSGREYGSVLVGSNNPDTAENVAVKLVGEGLAKVRDNCQDETLKNAMAAAESSGKGIWAPDSASHVRNVTWEVENPRQLVDRMQGKPVPAVIENVRDGSTVRAFLLPDFIYVTVMMSGVRSPSVKLGSDGKPDPSSAEPYSEEAHFFTESRLLQRDVEIILESVNNKSVIGSVIHPNGNIAELLLKEGLAKCVDWSLACVSGGPEKYRKAQAEAKEKKLRVWKDFVGPTGPVISAQDKEFSGKVVEVVNGDALVIKRAKNDYKKVHLASIRPPRISNEKGEKPTRGGAGFKPLYDIPYMFDAREFLRKKLVGQTVQVTVDYIQPANNDFPEKTCCTVVIGGVNVAEALVSRGLATVVRYSADNDQRSSKYDDLLSAEDKAIKSNKGMHNKKELQMRKIADLSGDVAKSKQFFPFLQRAGKMQAVVEFVASASRYRVYIPRETCVITFLLSGISCPRGERVMPGGQVVEAEPFGTEALNYVKEMILQREVEIEVESMDKGGNFIGWCFFGATTNVSVSLVEEGYAASYLVGGGDRGGNYANIILNAEESAKRRKVKRWANYVPEEDVAAEVKAKEDEENEEERKVNYQSVVVTEVTSDAKFFAQHVDEGPKLEQLMKQIREEFSANPPLAGAYQPRKGDTCAAKFVDNQWYRAKVEKVSPSGDVNVFYIDYGNKAVIPKAQCGALPGSFSTMPGFAKEYHLALCQLPPDQDYVEQGIRAMKEDLLNKKLRMNVEYKVGGVSFVSMVDAEDQDIGKNLVLDGLMMAERKGGRRLQKLASSYQEAMEKAKKNHLNIWQYGDITVDDAKEFGLGLK